MGSIDDICYALRHQLSAVQATDHFDNEHWFHYLGYASALVNVLFFAAIWRIKELQVHPMRLLMYITVCDASLLVVQQGNLAICDHKQYKLFAWTVFWSNDDDYQILSLAILVISNAVQFFLSFCMSFFLNSSLCLDLILVLHNPFKSAEKRLPLYVWASFVGALTMLTLEVLLLWAGSAYAAWISDILVFAPVSAFFVSAVFSVGYAAVKLH